MRSAGRFILQHPSIWVITFILTWIPVSLLPQGPTDLDVFFWPSAKMAVLGHPLLAYQPAGQDLYPNANGPGSLAILALIGMVVKALGWLDTLYPRRLVTLTACSVLVVLMAREAVRAVDNLRGAPMGRLPRLAAYAVFAISPPVWHAIAGYGHVEQPLEIWLVLLATRWAAANRPVRAGVALGLAILTRTPAALLTLTAGLRSLRQGFPRTVLLIAVCGLTGALGLLPFYLADKADVTHSLFTYRAALRVGAGSIWSLTRGATIESLPMQFDMVFVGVAILLVNIWLATRPGGLSDRRTYAGLALSGICFTLLAKTVWPYYFFEVFIFLAIFTIGSWRPKMGRLRLLLPLAVVGNLGFLAEYGSTPFQAEGVVRFEGVAMAAILLVTAGWLLVQASRADPEPLASHPQPPARVRAGDLSLQPEPASPLGV